MGNIYKEITANIVGTTENKGVLKYIKNCLPIIEAMMVEVKPREESPKALDLYFNEFLIGRVKEEELNLYEKFKLRYGLYTQTYITKFNEEDEEFSLSIEWI